MNIHYFQHAAFEGPGIIEHWANAKRYSQTFTRFFENDELPRMEEVDCLIVMGGPMGVYDEEKFPWLKAEKKFIADAIAQKKIVIGICLGAQLLAEACGARVFQNSGKEIGWFPVTFSKEGQNNILQGLPDQPIVFHWHGDTFNLPPHAVRLASSKITKNQAFLIDGHLLGLQFHLEATAESISGMLKHCKDDLVQADFVQNAEEIGSGLGHLAENNKMIYHILNKLTGID